MDVLSPPYQIPRSSRTDSESIMLASSTREDEKPGLESEAGAAVGLALPPHPDSSILTGGLRMTWWGGGMRYGLVVREPQDERVGGAGPVLFSGQSRQHARKGYEIDQSGK